MEGQLFTLAYGAISVTRLHWAFSAGPSEGAVLDGPFLPKLGKSLERRGRRGRGEEGGRRRGWEANGFQLAPHLQGLCL